MWQLSQSYHVRPSELLGISGNAFHAWMVDRAVWAFASEIEHHQEVAVGRLPNKAKEATKDHVRAQVLNAFLDIDPTTTPKAFRDPSGR